MRLTQRRHEQTTPEAPATPGARRSPWRIGVPVVCLLAGLLALARFGGAACVLVDLQLTGLVAQEVPLFDHRLMQMEAGLDTGPVLLHEAFAITPDDTSATLHDRLAALGARLVVEALGKLPLPATPQVLEGVTYAQKIGKADADKGVFNALGLGGVKHENDAVTQTSQILQKYPQIGQTLQQLGPQAVQQAGTLRRQLEQLERDRKATTAAVTLPNRTEHLERLDQQITAKREQLMPWETVEAAFNTPESPNAMKALLTLDKRMNKSLEQNEKMRLLNLTESEKNAKKQIDLQTKEYHVEKVGPAQVENALNQWAAQNPGATEDQLRGKAAEFGQAYKKQFGVMPDMNKVLDSFVTKKTQSTILTGEERKTVSEAETNVAAVDTLIRDFKPEYFGPMDNALNSLRAKMPEGSPQFMKLSQEVQEYRQRVELYATQYRHRIFGASFTDGEKEAALKSVINLDMGDTQARASLAEMKKWDQKVIESTKRNAQKSEQVKQGMDPYAKENRKGSKLTLGGFEAYWNQNKGKYGDDMDRAAKDYKAANEG